MEIIDFLFFGRVFQEYLPSQLLGPSHGVAVPGPDGNALAAEAAVDRVNPTDTPAQQRAKKFSVVDCRVSQRSCRTCASLSTKMKIEYVLHLLRPNLQPHQVRRLDPGLRKDLAEILSLQKWYPKTQKNGARGNLSNLPSRSQICLKVT